MCIFWFFQDSFNGVWSRDNGHRDICGPSEVKELIHIICVERDEGDDSRTFSGPVTCILFVFC